MPRPTQPWFLAGDSKRPAPLLRALALCPSSLLVFREPSFHSPDHQLGNLLGEDRTWGMAMAQPWIDFPCGALPELYDCATHKYLIAEVHLLTGLPMGMPGGSKCPNCISS